VRACERTAAGRASALGGFEGGEVIDFVCEGSVWECVVLGVCVCVCVSGKSGIYVVVASVSLFCGWGGGNGGCGVGWFGG
jgi:hypothetical protein